MAILGLFSGKGNHPLADAREAAALSPLTYADCMTRVVDTPKALSPARLALLSVRLLHAYAVRLKWEQFRYRPTDAASG